jgi:hypothetical protein
LHITDRAKHLPRYQNHVGARGIETGGKHATARIYTLCYCQLCAHQSDP